MFSTFLLEVLVFRVILVAEVVFDLPPDCLVKVVLLVLHELGWDAIWPFLVSWLGLRLFARHKFLILLLLCL